MELSLPPPDYNSVVDNDDIAYRNTRRDKLIYLINKYEIDPYFSEKMEILNKYEIVLLCDDSGSMNAPIKDNKVNSTRWEELKSVVKIVISIATIYDRNGIDIYLLNRGIYENIKSEENIENILEDEPCGGTPLTFTLRKILEKYNENNYSKKPLLVVIATDGVPTDSGNLDLDNFKRLLENKNHDKVYISFLACSDNENDVGYLNDLDKNIPSIDTLDDYISELKEVRKVQGKDFRYSFSDHIVRLLLGPLCPEMDKLDEERINKKQKSCILS